MNHFRRNAPGFQNVVNVMNHAAVAADVTPCTGLNRMFFQVISYSAKVRIITFLPRSTGSVTRRGIKISIIVF